MNPPITICPPRYADGYIETIFEEFRPTGGTYIHPNNKDKYTRMSELRERRKIPAKP
jgi:hypothetical protein